MTTLILETEHIIKQVSFTNEKLTVDLADGRSISIPLCWYPRLMYASAAERQRSKVAITR